VIADVADAYSITSSACATSDGEIVEPRDFAVSGLITNSRFFGLQRPGDWPVFQLLQFCSGPQASEAEAADAAAKA
jgi:hypothetical protein